MLAFDAAVCEIMQRGERELVGMCYADLTYVDDVVINVAMVEQTRPGARPTVIRKRYVRPDRSLIWSTVQVSRLTTGSDRGRLIGTLQCAADQPHRLWQAARRAAALAEQRRVELGSELFRDHAWTVLLQVYLAECEARLLEPASAGIDGMSEPQVHRWLNALVEHGLVERQGIDVQLSGAGNAKVERMLESFLAM